MYFAEYENHFELVSALCWQTFNKVTKMLTTLSPASIAAYQATHYQVFVAGERIALRIGVASTRLHELYIQHDVTCSGFLTAWNSYSANVSPEANRDAQTFCWTNWDKIWSD